MMEVVAACVCVCVCVHGIWQLTTSSSPVLHVIITRMFDSHCVEVPLHTCTCTCVCSCVNSYLIHCAERHQSTLCSQS